MQQATIQITFNTTTEQALALAKQLQNVISVEPIAEQNVAEPTPAPEIASAPEVASANPCNINTALAMLDDERFTMRTVKSLMNKSGYTDEATLFDDLETFNSITIATRRRDGAKLVGWEYRN